MITSNLQSNIQKNQAFWKNPNQESEISSINIIKIEAFSLWVSPSWKTYITPFSRFFEKNLSKTKTFPQWVFSHEWKRYAQILIYIDHNGKGEERESMKREEEEKKRREGLAG